MATLFRAVSDMESRTTLSIYYFSPSFQTKHPEKLLNKTILLAEKLLLPQLQPPLAPGYLERFAC